MNGSTPFRDSTPSDLPDRVSKLEKDVASIRRGWRENLWGGWKKLGYVATWAAVLGGLYFIGTLTLFRGSAWGTAARQNAEREALRWARLHWPTTQPENVYCNPRVVLGSDEQWCFIVAPNRKTWRIVCDDDEPNDGCEAQATETDLIPPSNGFKDAGAGDAPAHYPAAQ